MFGHWCWGLYSDGNIDKLNMVSELSSGIGGLEQLIREEGASDPVAWHDRQGVEIRAKLHALAREKMTEWGMNASEAGKML